MKKATRKSTKSPKTSTGKTGPRRPKAGGTTRSGVVGAGVSTFMKQSVAFRGQGDTLGMDCVLALCDVAHVAANDGMIDGAGNNLSSFQLSPTNPLGYSQTAGGVPNCRFISPALDLIASAFTRYRVRKLKFHYLPQSSTATSTRMILAFAADPEHPAIWTTTPTFAGLESLADSVPFAPWNEFSMDVSAKLGKEWLYTFTDFEDGPSVAAASASRFANFGALGLVGSGTVTGASGSIYMELGIDFKEFCPISTTLPSALRGLRAKLKGHIAERDQGSRPIFRDASLATRDVSPSSSATKQVYKTLGLEEFRAYIREARSGGMEMGEAVKSVSSKFILSGPAMELVLHSGLMHALSHPSLDQGLPVATPGVSLYEGDDEIKRVPTGVLGPCLSNAKLDSSVPKAKGLLE